MRCHPRIAPNKAAVLPLSKKLAEPAERLIADLRKRFAVDWDASGSIGRRYRRQDEIGTPYCVTYDFDSEQDHQVTVRDRDTTEQERVAIERVPELLTERVLGY
jgi:glycyl-tRNA synthetase